jgi:hypothetical protein
MIGMPCRPCSACTSFCGRECKQQQQPAPEDTKREKHVQEKGLRVKLNIGHPRRIAPRAQGCMCYGCLWPSASPIELPMNFNPSYMISRIAAETAPWKHPTLFYQHSLACACKTLVPITSFCGKNARSLRGLRRLETRTRFSCTSHHDSCLCTPTVPNNIDSDIRYALYIYHVLYFVSFRKPSYLPTGPCADLTRRITSSAHRPRNQSNAREQPNIDPWSQVTPRRHRYWRMKRRNARHLGTAEECRPHLTTRF